MADAVGIDLSAHQSHTPDLSGQDFVWARASYGDAPDVRYDQHAAAARKAGAILGAYLFGRDQDPADQVRAFLTKGKGADMYAVDYEEDRGHPSNITHPQVRSIVAKLRQLGKPVMLYATPSTVFDAGQDGDWLAAPGQSPLGQPWRFRQHQSAQLGMNRYHGTRADLEDWLGMKRLLITDTKARIVGLPKGINVYDLTGQVAHPLSTARDERVDLQVTVGPDGPRFYVIPTALAGDPAVGLVRVGDVTDKGAPPSGGASQAALDAAHQAGFDEAKAKALAAVQAI